MVAAGQKKTRQGKQTLHSDSRIGRKAGSLREPIGKLRGRGHADSVREE